MAHARASVTAISPLASACQLPSKLCWDAHPPLVAGRCQMESSAIWPSSTRSRHCVTPEAASELGESCRSSYIPRLTDATERLGSGPTWIDAPQTRPTPPVPNDSRRFTWRSLLHLQSILAGLIEVQTWTAGKQFGGITVAEVADEVGLDVTIGEVLLVESRSRCASREEFVVIQQRARPIR